MESGLFTGMRAILHGDVREVTIFDFLGILCSKLGNTLEGEARNSPDGVALPRNSRSLHSAVAFAPAPVEMTELGWFRIAALKRCATQNQRQQRRAAAST